VISFWKILLLVVVIAGVFFAVSIYKRSQKKAEVDQRPRQPPPKVSGIETIACAVCGTYIPSRGATKCERRDCPA
jgi:hypothetical protein